MVNEKNKYGNGTFMGYSKLPPFSFPLVQGFNFSLSSHTKGGRISTSLGVYVFMMLIDCSSEGIYKVMPLWWVVYIVFVMCSSNLAAIEFLRCKVLPLGFRRHDLMDMGAANPAKAPN